MTSTDIINLINHPETLDSNTLYEMRLLVMRFPYFQSLRLLYLKNLYLLHDSNFGVELRKSVMYVADRRILFYMIEGDSLALKPVKPNPRVDSGLQSDGEPDFDRTLTLIDAFLSEQSDVQSMPTELEYASDYSSFLVGEQHQQVQFPEPNIHDDKVEDKKIPQDETDDSERQGNDFEEDKEETDVAEVLPEEDEKPVDNDGSESLDDSYFTETLAKIYIKQHRYEKALEIIKKLNLKYPKKNIYFADQIRFLEKLIENDKTKKIK